MSETALEGIVLLPLVFALLGSAVGFVLYKRLAPAFRLLVWFLVASASIDVLSRVLVGLYDNNLIVVLLLGMVETVLFSLLFIRYLLSKQHAWIVLLPLLIFALLCVEAVSLFPYAPDQFTSYGKVLSSLLVVGFCVVYFVQGVTSQHKLKQSNWLLVGGTLIFFGLSTLWFLVTNFLINTDPTLIYYLWVIYALATPIFYLLILYLIWQHGTSQKR